MGRPAARTVLTATPERLLDAAEGVFAQRGLRGARLEDIAAAAGIRRPSLLYHYPSKEQLYAAVVRRTFARLGAALTAAMQKSGDFVARFDAVVAAYADYLAAHPEIARILVWELLDGQGPARELLLEQVVPLLDLVERFVRIEGRREIRPGLPVRAAILQIASDALLRAAAGEFKTPLWGDRDHTQVLARALFFPTRGGS
ncbi:MAG TPA: TetR family transcriptional regulator [Nannocystis sp.]